MLRPHAFALPLVLAAAGCADLDAALFDVTELAAAGPDTGAPPCDAIITAVRPDGELPVARTARITIEAQGAIDPASVKLLVTDAAGVPVRGEIVIGAPSSGGRSSIAFDPDATLAPGAHLVQASVCRSHAARQLEVGAVHHGLSADDLASLDGARFGLDLRYSTWVEPAPVAGRELVLATLFGGALVVELGAAGGGGLGVALRPATVALDGTVSASGPAVAAATRVENPYLLASFAVLDVTVDGRALALRDGALTLGLSADGVEDARLSAEVDVRDFGDVRGSAVCDVLDAHTDGACVPCASDAAPFCFALTLGGLAASYEP